ncbi:hypothetical protein DU508_16020 [Pedobacter chinensis]|uniref:Uncharacterized protein n=1 Tax=Pedobacter chinensis TaxID=2282421 RepID=A0A369PTC4_9SPHI|nr:hypothetical protein DU508_16020 [Pedobacter chinensis]
MSEGNLNDPSAMDVRIEIVQDLTNQRKNEISIFLYDENGKPVRNKAIKLNVNGQDLVYTERQELYYITSSKYWASDIPAEREYNFRIALSNGKSYFLGRISPLSENNDQNIVCDKTGNFNQDFVVSWKNLKDIDQLSVTKRLLLSNSTSKDQKYDFEPQPIKKIAGNGTFVLAKSSYINPKSTISSLELKFGATKNGVMNSQLLKGSEIKISGHIDRYVEFNGKHID